MNTAMDDTPAPRAPVAPGAPAPERGGAGATARTPASAPVDSTTLLQGGKAVTIRHNGELYRLQATRQGKLILTK